MRRQGAGGRGELRLCGDAAGDRHDRHDHGVAPEQHGQPGGRVEPRRVRPSARRRPSRCSLRRMCKRRAARTARAARHPAPRRWRPAALAATAVKPRMNSGSTSTASIASFTSFACTFLPRYSGVRPTISPATKTASSTNSSMAVEPGADAAGQDLAKLDQEQRDHPAERHEAVVHRVDAAVGRTGGRDGPKCRECGAEAHLLALHVAHGGVNAGGEVQRISARLRRIDDRHARDDEDHHHREQRPALADIADDVPEGQRQREWDGENRPGLQQIGPGRRVLEGMRGVHAEEPAAIRSESCLIAT